MTAVLPLSSPSIVGTTRWMFSEIWGFSGNSPGMHRARFRFCEPKVEENFGDSLRLEFFDPLQHTKFNLVMSGRQKSKKVTSAFNNPDDPDSLIHALAGEILAPENLNLVIPITAFTVPFLSK